MMTNQTQAGDFNRGSLLRRLDELLAEARKLTDERRTTLTGELEILRDRARYCLADIGTMAEDALYEVSKLTFRVPPTTPLDEKSQRECYENLHRLIGWLEQARDRLQKRSLTSPAKSKKPRAVSPFPVPPGARWEEVCIRIVSDHRVDIIVRDLRQTRNYSEMGFEDGRSGKPTTAWKLFIELGELGGSIVPAGEAGKWSRQNIEKRIQELRSRLREIFPFEDDPFEPFHRTRGYKARFKIECAESYET